MFDESSMAVQTWVRLIQSGAKEQGDVPALFNLQEVVSDILDS